MFSYDSLLSLQMDLSLIDLNYSLHNFTCFVNFAFDVCAFGSEYYFAWEDFVMR